MIAGQKILLDGSPDQIRRVINDQGSILIETVSGAYVTEVSRVHIIDLINVKRCSECRAHGDQHDADSDICRLNRRERDLSRSS